MSARGAARYAGMHRGIRVSRFAQVSPAAWPTHDELEELTARSWGPDLLRAVAGANVEAPRPEPGPGRVRLPTFDPVAWRKRNEAERRLAQAIRASTARLQAEWDAEDRPSDRSAPNPALRAELERLLLQSAHREDRVWARYARYQAYLNQKQARR